MGVRLPVRLPVGLDSRAAVQVDGHQRQQWNLERERREID
jgi:hypothetical protein